MKTQKTKKPKKSQNDKVQITIPEAVAVVIEALRSDFHIVAEKVDNIEVKIDDLTHSHEKLVKRVDALELSHLVLAREVRELTGRVGALEQRMGSLEQKIDSIDIRLKRVEQDVQDIKNQLSIALDKETVMILEKRVTHLEEQVASMQSR